MGWCSESIKIKLEQSQIAFYRDNGDKRDRDR